MDYNEHVVQWCIQARESKLGVKERVGNVFVGTLRLMYSIRRWPAVQNTSNDENCQKHMSRTRDHVVLNTNPVSVVKRVQCF